MRTVRTMNDCQPVAWLGRYPLYACGVIVCVHVLALIAASVVSSTGHGHIIRTLSFDSSVVLTTFAGWQTMTYAFVHSPTLWFAVEMLFFYWFGREVERFLGRRSFLLIYCGLILVPTLLLTATGVFFPGYLSGSRLVHLGIFVVFAAIYPSAELILHIQAKWIALILVALGALSALDGRDWPSLVTLAATCLAALGFARYAGIGNAFAWLDLLIPHTATKPIASGIRRRTSQPTTPRQTRRATRTGPTDIHDSIDPLLEKISRYGLDSLSSTERSQLEKARSKLLGKDADK